MKKTFLIFSTLFLATFAVAQNGFDSANKSSNSVEKATIDWSHTYNLTAEQTKAAFKIQENKYQNLLKIESLKTSDLKKYVAKRLSTFTVAENDLMVLLDDNQLKTFKQQQVEKSRKYDSFVSKMKKQGLNEAEMNQKMVDLEF